MLRQPLENQLAQDNKAWEKGKTDDVEFATSLAAEKADLADAEKGLASLVGGVTGRTQEQLCSCGLGSRVFRGRCNAGSPE